MNVFAEINMRYCVRRDTAGRNWAIVFAPDHHVVGRYSTTDDGFRWKKEVPVDDRAAVEEWVRKNCKRTLASGSI